MGDGRRCWTHITMACSGRGESILFMVFPATGLAGVRAAPLKPSVGSLLSQLMDRRSLITIVLSVVAPILFITFVRCDHIHSICEVEVPLLTFIFPYAVLSIIRFPDVDALFYTLAIVQFPAYSAVWYVTGKRRRFRGTGWLLVGLHLVVALAAFVILASSLH